MAASVFGLLYHAWFDSTGGNDLVWSIGRMPQSASPVDEDQPPYTIWVVASSGPFTLNSFAVSTPDSSGSTLTVTPTAASCCWTNCMPRWVKVLDRPVTVVSNPFGCPASASSAFAFAGS